MTLMITDESLISILKDKHRRATLARMLEEEHPPASTSLHNQLMELSSTCVASANDLIEVFESVLSDNPGYHELVAWLVCHPEMPEQLLLKLACDGKFISQLGHRQDPRVLLERLAADYRCDEAITTLAIQYYATESVDEFCQFVTEYSDCWMMGYNLAISLLKLDSHKSAFVKELFQTKFSSILATQETIHSLCQNPSAEFIRECAISDNKHIQQAILELPDLPKPVLLILSEHGKTKAIRREAAHRLSAM